MVNRWINRGIMESLASIKASFSGGMRYSLGDSTKLAENEYVFLSNGRNYSGVISPVKGVLDTGKPEGTLQGLYGFGDYLLCFVSGLAYYKRLVDNRWNPITSINLDPSAPIVYAAAVPASSINHERALITADNLDSGVRFNISIPGSPAGIVISDGITQPWILFSDGHARRTATYNDWQVDGEREYVPVGITNLLWANGKLYGVTKGAVISSVTGRPLDFVTLVDINGDKEPGEDEGGALAVGHHVDFSTPVALHATGREDGSLLLCTNSSIYLLVPDFEQTISGEHTFTQRLLSDIGAPSPFSGIPIAQDFAFVDFTGPKTLQELVQLGRGQVQGKKDYGFAASITDLFAEVTQSQAAAVNFEGYSYFLVNTLFGQVLLVWDAIGEKWVSVDKYSGVGDIKFMAITRTGNQHSLFLGGDLGIWQCFAASTYETCTFYPMDLAKLLSTNSQMPKQDVKLNGVHLCFSSVFTSGEVSVTPYAANKASAAITANIYSNATVSNSMPFARNYSFPEYRVTFTTPEALSSWRVGAGISWNVDAQLSYVMLEAQVMDTLVSYGQQSFA